MHLYDKQIISFQWNITRGKSWEISITFKISILSFLHEKLWKGDNQRTQFQKDICSKWNSIYYLDQKQKSNFLQKKTKSLKTIKFKTKINL